jgi:SAM-dependent methyltransferase
VNLVTRLKNSIRGATQKWGSPALKRSLWNREFQQGRWDFIQDTKGDVIYPILEKYCRKGELLDLGCGTGNTGCELNGDAYSKYIGVDISDVALEKARHRSETLGRSARNEYVRGDIASYQPTGKFQVILFRESIYYIPGPKIVSVLRRYGKSLSPGGVIIIRTHNEAEARAIEEVLESSPVAVEQKMSFPDGVSVLVLRPSENK